jgi:hypothetical protein
MNLEPNPPLRPGEPPTLVIAHPPFWRWADGSTLPVLSGSDGTGDDSDEDNEPPDDPDDSTDDDSEDEEEEEEEEQPSEKSANRAHRDAAKYRVQRNELRVSLAEMTERAEQAEAERDAVRGELAFERAARDTFIDTAAAWKLANRAFIKIADDGSLEGMDEAVADLIERQPFLVRPDDEPGKKPEPNPFTASRSGRPVGNARPPKPGYDKASLSKKYPALRNR